MEISSSDKKRKLEKLERMMKVVNSMSISLTKEQLGESILNHIKLQTEIPDHPPYSFMIRRAIEELNQTKGSSKEAISKFIKENYQHIPFAHEVLLSNQLQKLCDIGEIAITNDDNYALE